jgi:hypothetical protein
MKYFFDTEFLEGRQKLSFGGMSKPTIDLISIGIVCEDGREYYAISKDFNLKDAWNRYQQRTGEGDLNNLYPRKYWIRDNVLYTIYEQLLKQYREAVNDMNNHRVLYSIRDVSEFSYKTLKWLLKHYGKSNQMIANEIVSFIYGVDESDHGLSAIESINKYGTSDSKTNPEFYAYFADYDWVVFCWLYGNMMSLPQGYPRYCRDLKQMLDQKIEKIDNISKHFGVDQNTEGYDLSKKLEFVKATKKYPKNTKEHDAMADAKWNHELYKFILEL